MLITCQIDVLRNWMNFFFDSKNFQSATTYHITITLSLSQIFFTLSFHRHQCDMKHTIRFLHILRYIMSIIGIEMIALRINFWKKFKLLWQNNNLRLLHYQFKEFHSWNIYIYAFKMKHFWYLNMLIMELKILTVMNHIDLLAL